jgi:26S proteasome regulatory subunit N5
MASFSAEIERASTLCSAGQLEGALHNLLALEKSARLGGDAGGTTELVTAMIRLCYEAKDWQKLNETITMLAKRRAQLTQAITALVQQASKYIDELPEEAMRLQLISTLRAVSEGKLFVEVERARLTKMLATMHEASGDVGEARKVMQDTQVETLGGMHKREKIEFILQQIRLCLESEDYVRAHIMAKKISVKAFKDVELEDLKIRYYQLIVRYHTHTQNAMEIFRAHQAMWDTQCIQSDEAAACRCLKLQVLHLVLAPYDKEQWSQMRLLFAQRKLEELPAYQGLLKLFITREIFHFAELRDNLAAQLTSEFSQEAHVQMLNTLHVRITQHNIQVVSGYYARIGMERLANLLGLGVEEMEMQLCDMVAKKQVYARIDRTAATISFSPPRTPNQLLNAWSYDIALLLNKLESTCHLIHKENMIHKIV